MIENRRLWEKLGVMEVIPAQLANNTTKSTGWYPLAELGRVLALINVGATDTTVDAVIQKATDGTGTGAVTFVAATQWSATDDNKQELLEVIANAAAEGFTHVRILITIGNGATGANVGAWLLSGDTRYGEEYLKNNASVKEIKSV